MVSVDAIKLGIGEGESMDEVFLKKCIDNGLIEKDVEVIKNNSHYCPGSLDVGKSTDLQLRDNVELALKYE